MNCCPNFKKETNNGESLKGSSDQPDFKDKPSLLINFIFSIIIFSIILFFFLSSFFGRDIFKASNKQDNLTSIDNSSNEENLPTFSESVSLPVKWGDLGKRMLEIGVIDKDKIEAVYGQRGGLDEESIKILSGSDNGNLVINLQNSGFILNMLWAFGLANRSPILDNGPMQDERYGGAGKFASTGGWTLSKSKAMDYYSKSELVVLTQEQELLVESVSKNIYRPCCGNSTYFPDCNHGMAMLGLLELMASQGASEDELYKTALVVNSYWFPNNYKTIARYAAAQGRQWKDVDPKEILGFNYSSSAGYSKILSQVEPVQGGGSGCGV